MSTARSEQQKLRVTLQSYDYRLLDQSAKDICDTARNGGADVIGPVRLKTHIRKYCVNRSPHIDKKARDQFEMRTHKRLIDISAVDGRIVDGLMKFQIPAGVSVDINLKGDKK